MRTDLRYLRISEKGNSSNLSLQMGFYFKQLLIIQRRTEERRNGNGGTEEQRNRGTEEQRNGGTEERIFVHIPGQNNAPTYSVNLFFCFSVSLFLPPVSGDWLLISYPVTLTRNAGRSGGCTEGSGIGIFDCQVVEACQHRGFSG
jgi:hypothetical protein